MILFFPSTAIILPNYYTSYQENNYDIKEKTLITYDIKLNPQSPEFPDYVSNEQMNRIFPS